LQFRSGSVSIKKETKKQRKGLVRRNFIKEDVSIKRNKENISK